MLRRDLLIIPVALAASVAVADDDKRVPDETLTSQQIDVWVSAISPTINAPNDQAVAASVALGQLASNLKARLRTTK